jgi:hypothetical protein
MRYAESSKSFRWRRCVDRMRCTGTLLRIVKDDAKGVTQTAADPANAVPEIDAIAALRTFHWPVMNREHHGIALRQRHHLDPALHARALFRQDKLAAGEIALPGSERRMVS